MDATDDDKIKQSIGQALLEAKLELQKFANWLEFDNKSLLSIFVVVYVWSWDAMLRIRGLSDQIKVSDDLESWKPICQEMEEQREKISLDHLTHACTAGVDITSILILGYLQIMIEEIRKEVWRRVEPLKVGKQFVLWLDGLSNFRVEDFLKVIEPPPAIKLKSGKLIMRSEPSQESTPEEKAIDHEGLKTQAALEFYQALKAAVRSAPFGSIPFSPVVAAYPNVSPVWERVFPKIVEKEIEANLTELLPILNRDMEKFPLKAFNAYRQRFRKELSFSALKGEAGDVNDDSPAPDSTLKATSKIHHGELERERLSPDIEEALDKKRRIKKTAEVFSQRFDKLLEKAYKPTRPKIRKAIGLILEDYSLKDSARKSGIDEKTLRHYVLELDLAPVKATRSNRKS